MDDRRQLMELYCLTARHYVHVCKDATVHIPFCWCLESVEFLWVGFELIPVIYVWHERLKKHLILELWPFLQHNHIWIGEFCIGDGCCESRHPETPCMSKNLRAQLWLANRDLLGIIIGLSWYPVTGRLLSIAPLGGCSTSCCSAASAYYVFAVASQLAFTRFWPVMILDLNTIIVTISPNCHTCTRTRTRYQFIVSSYYSYQRDSIWWNLEIRFGKNTKYKSVSFLANVLSIQMTSKFNGNRMYRLSIRNDRP